MKKKMRTYYMHETLNKVFFFFKKETLNKVKSSIRRNKYIESLKNKI